MRTYVRQQSGLIVPAVRRAGGSGGSPLITTDSFDRADGTSGLGTTDIAAGGSAKAWTSLGTGTDFGISSNQAYKVAGSGSYKIAYIDAGTGNHEVQVTLTRTTTTSTSCGLAVRVTDINNCYFCIFDRNASGVITWDFGKLVAGAETKLGFGGGFPVFTTDPTTVILGANGTTVYLIINGELVWSGTDATFGTSLTKCGIMSYSAPTAARWNDFVARTPQSYVDKRLTSDGFSGSSTTRLSARNTDVAAGGTAKAWADFGSGTWSLNASAQAAQSGGAAFNGAVVPTLGTDTVQRLQIITGPSSTKGVGLVGRWADASNFYIAYWYKSGGGTDQWYLSKVVAGVETPLGASPYTSPAPAANDVLELSCVGTAITMKVNGATVAAVTDSSLSSGTSGGVGAFGTSGAVVDHYTARSA